MENNKIILMADYGRSGQGWLSYMLCYILNARFIEPYALLRGLSCSGHRHILDFVQGHLPGREPSQYDILVKTHELPDPYYCLTDKIILLARDPRDVAVSELNRMKVILKTGTDVERSAQKISGEMKNALVGAAKPGQGLISKLKAFRRKYLPGRNFLYSLKIISYVRTAYRWSNFYSVWGTFNGHQVKYEDLHSNPKAALQAILLYLNVQVDEGLIDEAIQKFDFSQYGSRKKGAEDGSSVEARKGIVGDHKNHMGRFSLFLFRTICKNGAGAWGYKM